MSRCAQPILDRSGVQSIWNRNVDKFALYAVDRYDSDYNAVGGRHVCSVDSKFQPKERFCCRFATGAARSDHVYSLGLHLAGAELSRGRFASTGIAWDDNRSLISGEDQYRLCFLRHGFCGAGSQGGVAPVLEFSYGFTFQ
jgi:hypothetical protein